MGMFDSVNVPCKCGEFLEFQSKAGRCILATFSLDDAPPEILRDIRDDARTCPKCGTKVSIELEGRLVGFPRYDKR